MKGNLIQEKSYQFALHVIRLYKALREEREFVLSGQLLRCGTSIGANVEEATAAQSRKDFISKMAVASKEARETLYWLRLLRESGLCPSIDLSQAVDECHELTRILAAIVKTTQQKT